MKVCILAGGSGSRLWPYSRPDFPKQFLPLLEGKSLFAAALKRAFSIAKREDIFVITRSSLVEAVQNALAPFNIDKENILVEPKQKNTAPAVAYALKTLKRQKRLTDKDPVLFLPSDHWIEEDEEEWKLLIAKSALAVSKGHIALFGVPPMRPETSYGYIKVEKEIQEGFFSIKEFVEKPAFEKAEEYLSDRSYFWNSGIFMLSYTLFSQEIEKYCPELHTAFSRPFEEFKKYFEMLAPISIDYALMEKTEAKVLVPFTLRWSDLGTWESIYENSLKDKEGNVFSSNVFALKTQNSLVFGGRRLISLVGVDDIVVIDTADALLITRKGKTQEAIAKTLAYLEEKKENSLLTEACALNQTDA